MSRQNKAFAKSKLNNPQRMPKKHTKKYWRTSKGTMISREHCSSLAFRQR